MDTLPIPPMKFNLWGTVDEAKPLGSSTRSMLGTLMGVREDAGATAAREVDLDAVTLSPVRLQDADLQAFADIVGAAHVSTDDAQRAPRARGKSSLDLLEWRAGASHVVSAPDAVLAPGTEDEVLDVLRFCSREGIAVVPFGGGTSVVGGLTPVDTDGSRSFRGVVSLDLVRFDRLSEVDAESGLATLGAGLTGPAAELLLADHGLQIGHYPQSFPYATIGGYAVTRSSGQNSAGYGRFDDMVRELTLVTPVGVMTVGHASPASAAGPDLRELVMGSEGVFGVVTRVRLRVHPVPQVKRYEAFTFPDFATGVAALRAVKQTGTGPTVIRLSDEIESSVNLSSGDKAGESSSPPGCMCITMYEGTEAHTASRHAETRDLLLSKGATSVGEEPARHWEQGRFNAPVLRDSLLDAGALCETLETCTDWSNVSRLKKAVGEALAGTLNGSGTMALIMCHVSHVYAEGCSLYFTVVAAQKGDPVAQWRTAKTAVTRALTEHGGTVTHHHAVGADHRPFMAAEIGELGVAVLRAVKDRLDPDGVMNPGTLIGGDDE
ncbi:MAG: FAD-binding oxidoreductase [Corynebacterium sp.]|uniref:FAD-binding oxidoreductase n=1 Tax=unclassified Corynebacterium TaxID=2624378 RepID=UPI003F92660F